MMMPEISRLVASPPSSPPTFYGISNGTVCTQIYIKINSNAVTANTLAFIQISIDSIPFG